MSNIFVDYIDKILLDNEKITEPPKKWVNRWLVIKAYRSIFLGGNIAYPGEFVLGESVWPSYEIAEQKALECVDLNIPRCNLCDGTCAARDNLVTYDRPIPQE